MITNTEISDVTLANDDGHINLTFQYNLNTSKTRKHLYEGATRGHYDREDKKTCINLTFSDGAFNIVVQKAMIELNNGPKLFIVGKEEVERVTIDHRNELTGKHVDTKIEFKVNNEKIVVHIYNTRQKLTIQGKRYKWFVDNYLEPFFKLRISSNISKIEEINKSIISKLKPKSSKQNMNTKTSLVEEAEILECDKCDVTTTNAENLRKHIVQDHTVNVFHGLQIQSSNSSEIENTEYINNCEKCEYKPRNSADHKKHMEIHVQVSPSLCDYCDYSSTDKDVLKQHSSVHIAEIVSKSLHLCSICSKNIETNEPKIQCDDCYYFFHKNCTNRKGKGGKRPKCWKCEKCQTRNSVLNVHAPTFVLPALTNSISEHSNNTGKRHNIKIPTLTGKHRKSGLCEHPGIDFLEMQIETLKSTVAQKELEATKLKQSDVIKTKQINNLEAKLQEAMKTLHQKTNNSEIPEMRPQLNNNISQTPCSEENSRLQYLEIKSSNHELQLGLLASKFDSLLMKFVTSANTSPVQENSTKVIEKFICEICNFEVQTKGDIEKHKKEHHQTKISCHKCQFTTTNIDALKNHKTNEHPQVLHHCQYCEFETIHLNQLNKHTRTNHKAEYECKTCCFRAMNTKDLHDHFAAKHSSSIPCENCSYKAYSKSDLNRHLRGMHVDQQFQSRYFRASQRQVFTPIYTQNRAQEKPKKAQNEASEKAENKAPIEEENGYKKSLHCVGICDSLQKSFTHEDELNLHMNFYHTPVSPQ